MNETLLEQRDLNRFPEFSERLETLRRRLGKTQQGFAQYVEVSPKSMWRYLNGKQLPSGDEMLKLALKFPGEMNWLMTGREQTDIAVLQHLMNRLSIEDQGTVLMCAHILASNNVGFIRIIRAVIQSAKETFSVALSIVRGEESA